MLAFVLPVVLLIASNIFMTAAWYGHLRHQHVAIWIVILVSWGIAFFEYCLQVPANRLGHRVYTATQLKIMQEAITVVVFLAFAWLYLKEVPRRHELIGLAIVLVGIGVAQFGGPAKAPAHP